MTEDEVRALLREHRWNWCVHRHFHQAYVYARRRRRGAPRGKFEERYIAPLSHLPSLSEADVTAKLTR